MANDSLAALGGRLRALGGEDLLVFARVSARHWAHLGGIGRGAGWAGIVELTGDGVPDLEPGGLCSLELPSPRQVVGPYQASRAVLVRVSGDRLVVAGSSTGDLDLAAEADWRTLAADAIGLVGEAAPAKRLADELEVLQAVQELALIDTGLPVPDVLAAIAAVVAGALSCELAAVHVPLVPTQVLLRSGATFDRAAVAAAVEALADGGGTRCVQEASAEPLPAADRGIRSWLLLPLPMPMPGAAILVAHTDLAPRGFTSLCQDMGERLAEAAGLLIETAASRSRASAEARALAERDHLTGLGNRAGWERLVDEAQAEIAAGGSFGVLVIDMDDLKVINDGQGHEAGDIALRALADLLRASCPDDALFRLGGDEFAVLIRGPQADIAVAERKVTLEAALGRTHGSLVLRASIGCCATGPGDDLRACMRRADQQMYARKSAARHVGADRRRPAPGELLERSLRALLAADPAAGPGTEDPSRHGLLRVALQPIVELPTGRVVGVESLARWTHPVLGDVPPAVFVPQAEQAGLIARLDRLVLVMAAREVVARRTRHPRLWLSANVSARGLRAGGELAAGVAEVLLETGLPATALQLELTEMALGCAPDVAADALVQVRTLGVRLALDDLGSGQSALLRVASLPVTGIKIDRALVVEAARSERAYAVLAGVVAMMHGLGLAVCLEGVETPEEVEAAIRSGAELAQGYAYGAPGLAERKPDLRRAG